ncbi:hypothetical protein [Peredibacter starrii]|uniref:Uncharacterized protein n=1 Tax=Peredibacter starrii TaxID=28202 RepID=A0AAX4HQJ5_9BACT|nr:hypothetical protein [Peredibacter starrii]WPU65438.1 hypothetical protein SOO65_01625 [Peredibacter starrii]
MNALKEFLEGIVSDKASSRTVVGITALINLVGSLILIYGLINKPFYETVLQIRIVHVLITSVVLILLLKIKDGWNSYLGAISYLILYTPIFFTGWYNHVAIVEAQILSKPYGGFPVVFMMLAVLVPYSYLLNSILLALFSIETVIIWYAMDLGSKPFIAGNGEPFYIVVFAFVCFCLLFLRFRIDTKVHKLMEQKARSEFVENLARTFLSMRDRNNTPLQSLLILSSSLKNDKPMTQEQIDAFKRSVMTLISSNKNLVRYETKIQWGKRDLMTDSEIETWLSKIEDEVEKDKK